ncbi:hypothetical protein L210DRAFT_3535905 [Boletus edulis BED1]|uniref:Secreted protein n=1 Tax=Boletus edulis BED1 TaxID=1328754 RepID=A0AAD4BB37_BOLED|nr:hypothetical protein L210DRAFT_3587285 [Boletus edulis BED1]KAF8442155.1 hypothetical protein L210DRAFT_3535905 [Boletus edulis BED1]
MMRCVLHVIVTLTLPTCLLFHWTISNIPLLDAVTLVLPVEASPASNGMLRSIVARGCCHDGTNQSFKPFSRLQLVVNDFTQIRLQGKYPRYLCPL